MSDSSHRHDRPQRIVIAGGGFAGFHAAGRLVPGRARASGDLRLRGCRGRTRPDPARPAHRDDGAARDAAGPAGWPQAGWRSPPRPSSRWPTWSPWGCPIPRSASGCACRATLASVWADLLAREEVTVPDDFFDLGGDSLTAIRLIARVRKATGVKLSLKDVLTTPTLGAQAELLVSRTSSEA
jgi:aryl carrier-like protein